MSESKAAATNESQPLATPLRLLSERDGASNWRGLSLQDANGHVIANMVFALGADERARARKIVRACNSHDALLAALKAVVAVLQKEAPGTPLNHHQYDAVGAQALAAIAKAEGN